MSQTTQRKDRLAADKQKIITLLKARRVELSCQEIATELKMDFMYTRALLIAMLKSQDVCRNPSLWSLNKRRTTSRKKEPLYPNFDKEHEEWKKRVLVKKQRFNPFGQ